jgi:hypothetical protein
MDPQLDSNLLVGVGVGVGGRQLVATGRADGVAAEPLGDAVLVEGVGAGHRPEFLVGAEGLQADGAVLPLARAARRHLRQALQGGLAGPSTLAAAVMAGLGQQIVILIVIVQSGNQSILVNAVVDIEQARHRAADVTAGSEVGRADRLHRPSPRASNDMQAHCFTLPAVKIHRRIGLG